LSQEEPRRSRQLVALCNDDSDEYSDVGHLISALSDLSKSGSNWAFRGQQHDWCLESPLRRYTPQASWYEAEKKVLSIFQRRAHLHTSIPETGQTLEWLALMRHHDAPTRLLDWTRSPYVAAFFAVADATLNDEPVIWAIDAMALNCRAIESLHKSHPDLYLEDGPVCQSSSRVRLGSPKFFDDIFMSPSSEYKLLIAPVEPFAMNERLAIQQGMFLCPTTLSRSFESVLTYMLEQCNAPLRPALRRLRIKQSLRIEVLRRLYEMNITYATLFPGLDGFAKSLKHIAEFVSAGGYYPHDF
jgi:hypothetical protein